MDSLQIIRLKEDLKDAKIEYLSQEVVNLE